ncbi:hypothetical protein LR48_Vigan01g082200 [Vigna angularis]|uniref:Uncharacterized protein n=1 Tax=Phaseolus angularis TaxID=3914 RepID=A0A0L9TLE6_PHAAN|nr:hypothetical protein LR48_Vigan01g082200 [Vigna angularis]
MSCCASGQEVARVDLDGHRRTVVTGVKGRLCEEGCIGYVATIELGKRAWSITIYSQGHFQKLMRLSILTTLGTEYNPLLPLLALSIAYSWLSILATLDTPRQDV